MVVSFKDGITGVCVTRPDPQHRGGPCAPGVASRPWGGLSDLPPVRRRALNTSAGTSAPRGGGGPLGSPRDLVTSDSTPGGQGIARGFGGKCHV